MTDQELIRLAAERVMGWRVVAHEQHVDRPLWILSDDRPAVLLADWSPLTDWRVAGEIVDRMRELGWLFDIGVGKYASASFYKRDGGLISYRHSDSVPRAITLAALMAMGVDVPGWMEKL